MMVKLHIFDMDHTLIGSDCDTTWKQFLVAEKLAPPAALAEADRFFLQYEQGCMDQDEFNAFQLREIRGLTPDELRELARKHYEKMVRPHLRPAAREFVSEQLAAGTPCVILSSTNRYLVEPVAAAFGVTEFYGTDLELAAGRFTGRIAGEYFAGPGKVVALDRICAAHGVAPADVAAYGDSVNDVDLLAAVGHPHAVSPSAALRTAAEANKWPILEWRA